MKVPYYGAAQGFRQGLFEPTAGRGIPQYPPRRGAVQTLGQVDESPRALGTLGYTLIALAGTAVGGGLIGYVASEGKWSTAVWGASFAVGLGSLSEMVQLLRERRFSESALTGAVGLAAAGYPTYRLVRHKGWVG